MNAWMHKTFIFPSFHFLLIFLFILLFFLLPGHPLGAKMHLANIPMMFPDTNILFYRYLYYFF